MTSATAMKPGKAESTACLKKRDCLFDESFPQPVEETDFSALSDEDVWRYIHGEYIQHSRISEEFKAFGLMIVPHLRPEVVRLLVVKNDTFDQFVRDRHDDEGVDPKIVRISKLVTQDLKTTGTKTLVEDQVVYSKLYQFNRKTESLYDDGFGVPVDDVDFKSLDEDKLWQYIRGEFFVKGRLSSEVRAFHVYPAPKPEPVKKS